VPLPEAGAPAPDFTLLTDTGEPLTLASLRGQNVVLFFYPKDNTPVCTKEACDFRDTFPKFGKLKAAVFGISADSVKSHAGFRKRFDLPYALLADTEQVASEAYGVWAQKSMFGHKYMGIERTTFVIDKRGNIAAVFPKVKTKGHTAAVMKVVAGLG
jgi:peroxiredoxin Q/BCP